MNKKMNVVLTSLMLTCFNAYAVECGSVITEDTNLTQDLDCSNYSGFAALRINGDAILKGDGYKIISPNTSAGIYAEGGEIRVRNTTIEVSPTAIGIQAYNVRKMVVNNSEITNTNIGVDYYTEPGFVCERLRVSNSNISNNNYGARVVAPDCEKNARFVKNDISYSNTYALLISSKKVRVSGVQENNFYGSANGLSLSGSERVTVNDIDFSNDNITGSTIFVSNSGRVKLQDLTLGNTYEAAHVYDADKVIVRNVTSSNSEVGLKVVNEQRDTELKVENSDFQADIALFVTGFGSAIFTDVQLENNTFTGATIENY